MMDQLTDHTQRNRAIDPTRSFVVQAPAGSGKTGLLVRRFLTLLTKVENPEEILAITFTRKATAEMRERIIGALSDCTDPEKAELLDPDIFNLARLAMASDKRMGWDLLTNSRRLKIQTIDSLCYELVKNMPWSARFGAPPGLLEDKQSVEFYREAAKRVLDHIEDNSELASHCANLITLVNADYRRSQALLGMMLRKRDHWMRGLELNSRDELEHMWSQVIEQTLTQVSHAFSQELKDETVSLLKFAASNLIETNPAHPICAYLDLSVFPSSQLGNLNANRTDATDETMAGRCNTISNRYWAQSKNQKTGQYQSWFPERTQIGKTKNSKPVC